MISIVPCHRDLRQMRFEVQREKINDPNLITEIEYFTVTMLCSSSHKITSNPININTSASTRNLMVRWSALLVENSELYPRYRAKQPHKLFPYNESERYGFTNTPGMEDSLDVTNGGMMAKVDLKTRLLNDMRQNLSVQVGDFFARTQNRDEILFKSLA